MMFNWLDMQWGRVNDWVDDSISRMIFVTLVFLLLCGAILVGGVWVWVQIFPSAWHTYTYCEPTVVSTGKTFVNGWRCR